MTRNEPMETGADGPKPMRDDFPSWQGLQEAKEYAEAIVDTLHEPLLVLSPDLRVKSANPAFYKHFEVSPEETEGQLIYRLGNDQWDIPELRTLLEDVLPDSNAFNDFEVVHDFEDLGWRTMLVNARRLDSVQLILLGIRDITERKRAEADLRQANEALEERVRERTAEVQTLASRVLLAEQRERERIARLLHDDVQQTLHALNIRIEHLAAQHGIDRNDEGLASALDLLRTAVAGTRSLSATIHPPVLQHGGLAGSLRWLAQHMLDWHDLHVDIDLDLEGLHDLEELRRVLVFHSLRELLFNVVKHAGVSRANVAAWCEGRELVITVKDDGHGFDVREALSRAPNGFGLATIRERLRFHGGDLEVDSSPGGGTRKTLRLPVAD